MGLGSGPRLKIQRNPDSEFNYIHFGIKINRKNFSFEIQKFVGSKNRRKIKKKIYKFQNFLHLQQFFLFFEIQKIFFLISLPKCIKLNSESVSRWVWV